MRWAYTDHLRDSSRLRELERAGSSPHHRRLALEHDHVTGLPRVTGRLTWENLVQCSSWGVRSPWSTHYNRNGRPRLLRPSQPGDPSSTRVGMRCPQESSSASPLVGDGKGPKPTALLCFVGNGVAHSVSASKGKGDAHPVRGSVMKTRRELVLYFHHQIWVTTVEKELAIPLGSGARTALLLSRPAGTPRVGVS